MRDDDGRLLGVLVATHVDSARAGREIWDTKKKSEQRERGRSMNFWTKKSNAFQAGTNVSSFRG
jgi:hypothetical protein